MTIMKRYFDVAVQLYRDRRHEEALMNCRQAGRFAFTHSAKALIHLHAGRVLFCLKKYQESLAEYEEAYRHDPCIAGTNHLM